MAITFNFFLVVGANKSKRKYSVWKYTLSDKFSLNLVLLLTLTVFFFCMILEYVVTVSIIPTLTHFYRSSTKIERSDKAVNRTEALRSLLKDPPMKQSFRDVYPTDLPPLSVVNYPQLDPHQDVLTVQQSSELPLGGFTPGPFFDKTLKLSDNHIPYLGRGEEEVDKRASAHQSEILGGKDSIR